jgi:hypothetical protein
MGILPDGFDVAMEIVSDDLCIHADGRRSGPTPRRCARFTRRAQSDMSRLGTQGAALNVMPVCRKEEPVQTAGNLAAKGRARIAPAWSSPMEHVTVHKFGMYWFIRIAPHRRMVAKAAATGRLRDTARVGKLLWTGVKWANLNYLGAMRFPSRGVAEQYLADNEETLQNSYR